MTEKLFIFWLVQAVILVFGISIGHSVLLLRLRREENRRRELELTLLEKRKEILTHGRKIAQDLEDALYRANVQQEIDSMIRKG